MSTKMSVLAISDAMSVLTIIGLIGLLAVVIALTYEMRRWRR